MLLGITLKLAEKRVHMNQEEPTVQETIVLQIEECKETLLNNNNEDSLEFAKWTNKKAKLRFNEETTKNFYIMNNCIYWADLGRNIGSEQDKHRPVLVVRSERNAEVCSIIPLTEERLNDGYWYHIDLEEMSSTALVEQLRVISKRRIDSALRKSGKICSITEVDWKKINEQLQIRYTLKPLRKSK